MTAPILTTERLKVGTVVQISVELEDKQTGAPYWWKRFAVVTRLAGTFSFEALTLKLHPDIEKDTRVMFLRPTAEDRREVVTILPEPWPQGVTATWMNALARRWFVPDAED